MFHQTNYTRIVRVHLSLPLQTYGDFPRERKDSLASTIQLCKGWVIFDDDSSEGIDSLASTVQLKSWVLVDSGNSC